jgi:hypothetical protein
MSEEFAYKWEAWIEAFQIFSKYSDLALTSIGAEHDVIYVWPKKKVSKEDSKRLKELHWTYDKDLPAWVRYI